MDRPTTALDAVSSLDADRILRTYVHLINATDRSNPFRADPDGAWTPRVKIFAGKAASGSLCYW